MVSIETSNFGWEISQTWHMTFKKRINPFIERDWQKIISTYDKMCHNYHHGVPCIDIYMHFSSTPIRYMFHPISKPINIHVLFLHQWCLLLFDIIFILIFSEVWFFFWIIFIKYFEFLEASLMYIVLYM